MVRVTARRTTAFVQPRCWNFGSLFASLRYVTTPQSFSDCPLPLFGGRGFDRLEDDSAEAAVVIRQPATRSGLYVERSGWQAFHPLKSTRIAHCAGVLSRLLVTVLHAPTARVRAACRGIRTGESAPHSDQRERSGTCPPGLG